MFGLGAQELLLVLAVVFLIFGAKRLPQLGSGFAKGIKNFKQGLKDSDSVDNSHNGDDVAEK